MGREVKRVRLDFDWPMDTIWKGYLSPYSPIECKACEGSGLNPATRKLSNDWYTHLRTDGQVGWQHRLNEQDIAALIEAGRLMDFTHVPRDEAQREIVRKKIADGGNSWLPFNNGYIPPPAEVNAWSNGFPGHDAINQWICVKARAQRLGIFGNCPMCQGQGHYWCEDKYEAISDAWEHIEPPVGEGWQMWETTSEGSPISPVFKTPEELAKWLADTGASTFGSMTTTYENWLAMILEGWAPSMMMEVSQGKRFLQSGVDSIAENPKDK